MNSQSRVFGGKYELEIFWLIYKNQHKFAEIGRFINDSFGAIQIILISKNYQVLSLIQDQSQRSSSIRLEMTVG